MDCDDSFNDFKETKCVAPHRIITRSKITKRKKLKQVTKQSAENEEINTCNLATQISSQISTTQNSETTRITHISSEMATTQSSERLLTTEVSEDEALIENSGSCLTSNIEIQPEKSSEPQVDFNDSNINKEDISLCGVSELAEWLCVVCKQLIPLAQKNSHFEGCIKSYVHLRNTVEKNLSTITPFTCDICKLDITNLTVIERCEHVNRCLDGQSESATSSNNPTTDTLTITECPLCLKNFETIETRLSHIKKCCKSKGISIQSVIDALHLQQRYTIERLALGLPPLPQKRVVEKKTVLKQATHVLKIPKSQAEADLQLAKALSLSFQEEEDRKDELSLDESVLNELCLAKQNPFLNLRPPSAKDRPSKKKKKNIAKPVPLLLLRTDEERQKLFEERISSILTAQFADIDENHSFTPKESYLWTLSGVAEDKISYYVQDMMEFVTPSDVAAGSKLQSLSQIPGHYIYTQKPCDFTYSSTQDIEGNINTSQLSKLGQVPSTQEMVDIIMDDDDDDRENKQISQNNGNCGFFCYKSDDFVDCNPVISSLFSLVGNMWMSDVDIVVSDESIVPAHALLLKLRCPALQTVLDEATDETPVLDWRDVTRETAQHFLHFVYTGTKRWPPPLAKEIAELATKYGMVINTETSEKDISKSMLESKDVVSSSIEKSIENFALNKVADSQLLVSQSDDFVKAVEDTSQNFNLETNYAQQDDLESDAMMITTNEKSSVSVIDKSVEDCLRSSPDLFAPHSDDKNCYDTECAVAYVEKDKLCSSITVKETNGMYFDTTVELNVESPKPIALTKSLVNGNSDISNVNHNKSISDFSPERSFKDPSPTCGFDDDTIKLTTSPCLDAKSPFCFSDESSDRADITVLHKTDDVCKFSTPKSSRIVQRFRKCLSGSFVSQSDFLTAEQVIKGEEEEEGRRSYDSYPSRIDQESTTYNNSRVIGLSDQESKVPVSSDATVIVVSSDDEMMDGICHSDLPNGSSSYTGKTIIERNKSQENPAFNSPLDECDEELPPLHLRLTRKNRDDCISHNSITSSSAEKTAALANNHDIDNNVEWNKHICSPKEVNILNDNNDGALAMAYHTPDQHSEMRTLPDLAVQISDSPVTPLPDYKNMVTPNIKMALKQYGVRALPKKKAIAILNHIYEETHPWVNINEPNAATSSGLQQSSPVSKKRKAPFKSSKCDLSLCTKKSKTKSTLQTANSSESQGSQKSSQKHSSSDIPASQSSNMSDSSDVFEDVFEEPDNVYSQGSATCIKMEIMNYIRSDKNLYAKILTYEPLSFESFHQELKDAGIKASASLLMDCLDELCITFSYARSEKFRQKQQARNQRFRKRALAQLSQQGNDG